MSDNVEAPLVGTITEDQLKQFVFNFQEEIGVTIKLVERIAYEIFGETAEEDLTPAEAYAFIACEYQKIDELPDDETVKALARIRLMRAVSVFSITMGVAVPTQFLVLDRNVYDTIQAMKVIEKNKKEIDALAAAKTAVEEVVTTVETPAVTH